MRDIETANKSVLENLIRRNPELFTEDPANVPCSDTSGASGACLDDNTIRQGTILDSIPTDDDIPTIEQAGRETKTSIERQT